MIIIVVMQASETESEEVEIDTVRDGGRYGHGNEHGTRVETWHRICKC